MQYLFLIMWWLLTMCCTSCKSDTVEADKPRIVVVLKTVSSEYWKFVRAGVRQACENYSVVGTVVGPASEGHVLEQVNLVEDVFSQRPDVLIIAPILPSTIIAVLDRFQETRIPILFLDTDAPWMHKTTYVGTDNVTAGRTGGEALAKMLEKGDKVALICGTLGNPTTDQRIEGAKEALLKAGLKIIAEQPGDSDKAKAMSVMENILQSHPDVKGVFAANDEMALGALRAIKEKGEAVKVIGTDGTVEAIQSILEGGLSGTVAQNPYMMGYKAIEAALMKIKGNKIEKRIDSGVEMIVRDSASAQLDFLEQIKKEAVLSGG